MLTAMGTKLQSDGGDNRMIALREILVPIDFSSHCALVAKYAAAAARHFQSKLTFLHVLRPMDSTRVTSAISADEFLAKAKEDCCKHLSLFLKKEVQGVDFQCLAIEGDPSEVIKNYVESQHVGLVMMPTRGCGAFRRFLLGSVAGKVLHDVDCPVWTSSHLLNGNPTASMTPKVIVCPIDFSSRTNSVLKWASDLASEFQGRLIVVHAIQSLKYQPETYYLEAEMRKALMDDARNKILKMLQDCATAEYEVRIEAGDVTTVVHSVVEDSGADRLVIGRTSGEEALGRLRTHSYALIRESTCPVISL